MKLIPQMIVLRELSLLIGGDNENIVESIVDYHFKEFVNQWPQLKRYRLNIKCKTVAQMRRLYESMNRMKQLRRLELILMTSYVNEVLAIELSPKSLSPLKRLTHLELVLYRCVLNETYFDSIHTHLPHLQSLKINTKLEITPTIEAMVEKLPKLKCFEFNTQ